MKRMCVRRMMALILSAALLLSTAVYAAPAEEDTAGAGVPESTAASEGLSDVPDPAEEADPAELTDSEPTDIAFRWESLSEDAAGRSIDRGMAAGQRPTLPEAGTYQEGELLVKLRQGPALMSAGTVFDRWAEESVYLFAVEDETALFSEEEESAAWYRLTLRQDVDLLDAWQELESTEGVVTVEPNYLRYAEGISEIMDSDPYIHSQTWLDTMNAPAAWTSLSESGKEPGAGIVVAVVDSGVDLNHLDLNGQLLPTGTDLVDKDNEPDDENGHGTHVAGIIAAARNDIGVRGVAYGAKILPVRVLDENGSGSSAVTAEGIQYAADNKANIINLSLGGYGYSQVEADAVQYAREKGCLVVAAAGNEGAPTQAVNGYGGAYSRPAGEPGVLTVMAADDEWNLASFSNYDNDQKSGVEYELMAPGVDILSTTYDGGYGYMSGTSMAAPAAAGAAAVLMGLGCSADKAFQILATAKTKTVTTQEGNLWYPALDLSAAVEKVSQTNLPAYPANAANCYVTAELKDQSGFLTTVDFSALNTSSRVYYRNSAFQSTLTLYLENIGGAGTLDITGTVGGCTVAQSVELGLGDAETVTLTWSGVPQVDEDGDVVVDLTVGTTEVCDYFPAYELKTPDEGTNITYNSGRYELGGDESNEAYLGGQTTMGTVWVLDADLTVAPGETLNAVLQNDNDKGLVIYQAKGKAITVEAGSSSRGALYLWDAALLGADAFQLKGTGYTEIFNCALYDPQIEWVDWMQNCEVMENVGEEYPTLSGGHFYENGFYFLTGLILVYGDFQRNMVNGCVAGQIANLSVASTNISYNTFVENFGDTANSVLDVYAQDGTDTSGFHHNSVIGPMNLYNNVSTSTLGKAYRTYYQAVGEDLLPSGVNDTLNCQDGSEVSTDSSALSTWGIGPNSPAFIVDVETGGYEYDSENGYYTYEVMFQFSTKVSGNDPYAEAYGDPMVEGATVKLVQDNQFCRLTGATCYDDWADYSLYGFYTWPIIDSSDSSNSVFFYATSLMSQSTNRWAPKGSESTMARLASLGAKWGDDGLTLSWDDPALEGANYNVKIYREFKGSDGTSSNGQIAILSSTKTYTDTDAADMPGGSMLTYTVTISMSGRALYGTVRTMVPLSAEQMGVKLTPGTFTSATKAPLTVSANGGYEINDCLTLTFPGVKATGVEFSQEVRDMGIPCGAYCDGESTVVYLGSGSHAFLPTKELFTLSVTPQTGTVTAKASSGSSADLNWKNTNSVAYAVQTGIGAAWDRQTVQLWAAPGYGAAYGADGKLLWVRSLNGAEAVARGSASTVKVFSVGESWAPAVGAAVLSNE